MHGLLETSGASSEIGELRRCSTCCELKTLGSFRVKNTKTGNRAVWCDDCRRAYGRQHYRLNRPVYLAKSRKRNARDRARVRELIDHYLRDHPCVDCGRSDITVLEFDHRDPSSKRLNIGRIALMGSWPAVLREIEKCDVRCANCHRRRTARQFGWARVEGIKIDPLAVRPGRSGRYAHLVFRIRTPCSAASPMDSGVAPTAKG